MAGDAAAGPSELMPAVAATVAAVWAILLGTAYLARVVLDLGRAASLLLLVGCYLALAAMTLTVIGTGGRGLLGAAGMLVPLAVGCALVARRRA